MFNDNEKMESEKELSRLIADINLRFTSGNDVQVPDIRLTNAEWHVILHALHKK